MSPESGSVSGVIIAFGILGAALTLQGCSQDTYESSNITTQEEEPRPRPQPRPEVALQANDNQKCDDLVRSQSKIFQEALQQDAPEYFNGIEEKFTKDFVQYPFCLQMDAFAVGVVGKEMAGDAAYQGDPNGRNDEYLDRTVKDLYFAHAGTWMKMCQDWADKNKQHQMFNLKMVRTVLEWGQTDDELKKQIAAFYNWKPWWEFFSTITKNKCTKSYTNQCHGATEAARQHMKQLVSEKTKNPQLRWLAFSDGSEEDTGNGNPPQSGSGNGSDNGRGSESLIQEAQQKEEASKRGRVYIANDDSSWSSLSQAKRHLQQRFLVPVELKAGGQQQHPRQNRTREAAG